MLRFFIENARWLTSGLLLTFTSSFGQTWFISLFAGEIKVAYGLSDGGWGALYTVATLSAAAMLFARGALADTMDLGRLAPGVAALFALAGLLMALGQSVWLLGAAIFLLRFCGQGMFSHIAMTAMGRWFRARRGRAVSISGLGYSLGEAMLPAPAVLLAGWIGWQATWAWSRGSWRSSSRPRAHGPGQDHQRRQGHLNGAGGHRSRGAAPPPSL